MLPGLHELFLNPTQVNAQPIDRSSSHGYRGVGLCGSLGDLLRLRRFARQTTEMSKRGRRVGRIGPPLAREQRGTSQLEAGAENDEQC